MTWQEETTNAQLIIDSNVACTIGTGSLCVLGGWGGLGRTHPIRPKHTEPVPLALNVKSTRLEAMIHSKEALSM